LEVQARSEDTPEISKPSVTDIVNPLFGCAGSKNIKKENNGDVQARMPRLRKRATTRPKKAATASMFRGVINQLQTKVAKDIAVGIDCTLLASDVKATVSRP
jgi:hypothetical protein